VLLVARAMVMAAPHLGRGENCLLTSKRKNIIGLRLNRNCLGQNFSKGSRAVIALSVVRRVISTKPKPSWLQMGVVDPQVRVPSILNSTNFKPLVRKSKRLPKTHFHTNAWRLIDSEFDTLNALFSFILEACCDPNGSNRHGSLPIYFEKDSFLSHDIVGQSVYCSPP
jgi:hypothetical protein